MKENYVNWRERERERDRVDQKKSKTLRVSKREGGRKNKRD